MTLLNTAVFLTICASGLALAGGAGGPAASLAGRCAPGFVQPSPAALSRDLASARARWAASGIRDYSLDFEQIAQPVRYPKTRVTVTAGRVVSARPIEEGIPSAQAGSASVEGLFAFIGQAAAYARTSPCTELKVRYAPDGYPVSFASELRLVNIADGGASFTVSNFIGTLKAR